MSSGRHVFEVATKRSRAGWIWCISYGSEGDCADVECGVEPTKLLAKRRAAAVKRELDAAFKAQGWRGVEQVVENRAAQGNWRARLRRCALRRLGK